MRSDRHTREMSRAYDSKQKVGETFSASSKKEKKKHHNVTKKKKKKE